MRTILEQETTEKSLIKVWSEAMGTFLPTAFPDFLIMVCDMFLMKKCYAM